MPPSSALPASCFAMTFCGWPWLRRRGMACSSIGRCVSVPEPMTDDEMTTEAIGPEPGPEPEAEREPEPETALGSPATPALATASDRPLELRLAAIHLRTGAL